MDAPARTDTLRRPVVEVEATVFPESWLRLLCERVGYDYARVVRRLVGPGPGE